MNRAAPLRRLRSRLFRLETVLARSDLQSAPAPVLARAQAVGRTVDAMSIRLPWHSTCLVRCVAGRIVLARRGIAGHILFGVNLHNGTLTAHAWLVTGGEPVIGGAEATGFTPNACLYAQPRTL